MAIRIAAGLALAAAFAASASAQEVVLKGASGFPEGTAYSVKF